MDTHAHLLSHGWRGSGHSLHPTSDSTGLSRPLLVSQKRNNNGVGKKQHKTSDMWWMNAFDETLKGLNTENRKVEMGTNVCGGLDKITMGTWEGLYEGFVKGEGLRGTLLLGEGGESQTPDKVRMLVKNMARKAERRAKKCERRAEKGTQDGDSIPILLKGSSHEEHSGRKSEGEAAETKSERRARKAARRAAKAMQNGTVAIASPHTKRNAP